MSEGQVNASRIVFRRLGSAGWLGLAGGMLSLGEPFPNLGDRLLEEADLSLPLLGITASGEDGQELKRFLADISMLLDTKASVLSVNQDPEQEVDQAGLILLAGDNRQAWLEALDRTSLEESLLRHLGGGGMVFAIGAPAATLGSWMLPDGAGEIAIGLGWLPGGILLPGIEDPAILPQIRTLLSGRIRSYALGLSPDTALALGPEGEVEVWSRSAPTLMLGKGWSEG